jgi:hypothetical protein
VVAAEAVGSPLHEAVHDLHPGIAGRRKKAFDIGQRLATCLLREHRQPGVGADDGALAFLRDDRGVPGRRDLCEIRFHADTTVSVGGTS